MKQIMKKKTKVYVSLYRKITKSGINNNVCDILFFFFLFFFFFRISAFAFRLQNDRILNSILLN